MRSNVKSVFQMELSKSDKSILSELQRGSGDGRMKLAEKIGLSATTLWRRVKELTDVGIIRGQVTLLDPDKLGYPVCVFVFVNLKDYSKDSRKGFEAFIEGSAQIMECFSVTGVNDYIMGNKLISKLLAMVVESQQMAPLFDILFAEEGDEL